MNKKILIIGETCLDQYVYGTIDRVCPEAPVLCFKTMDKSTTNLGMASNVKANLENLCSSTQIDIITNTNNIIKKRFIDNKYNTIVFREDIEDKCNRIKITDYNFFIYDIIIISDYCKGFLALEDIIYISENTNATIFIDTKKKISDIIPYVDIIKINNKEFNENFDTNICLNQYDTILVVTNGEKGATKYYKDKIQYFDVHTISVRDVCGAGDTFLAGLVSKYIETNNIDTSIVFANKCASKVIQKFGVCSI